MSDAVTQKFG
jgi:serine/threonine protein kinase